MGITAKQNPVTFRIAVEGSSSDLYSKVVNDPEVWEDADVDLSRYGGRTVKLVFRTDAERDGDGRALGESFADELRRRRSAQTFLSIR